MPNRFLPGETVECVEGSVPWLEGGKHYTIARYIPGGFVELVEVNHGSTWMDNRFRRIAPRPVQPDTMQATHLTPAEMDDAMPTLSRPVPAASPLKQYAWRDMTSEERRQAHQRQHFQGRGEDAFQLPLPGIEADLAGATLANLLSAADNDNISEADAVELPEHYARFKIEPVRFICENALNFFQGNIIKYVLRHDAKNGLEDLRKAQRYLTMFIKYVEGDPDWWRKPETGAAA